MHMPAPPTQIAEALKPVGNDSFQPLCGNATCPSITCPSIREWVLRGTASVGDPCAQAPALRARQMIVEGSMGCWTAGSGSNRTST